MRTKVDLLNDMNIDGVRLSFDETKGTIKETKDSIYRVIEALDKQAQMAAMTDVLKESYKMLYQAQLDNETATGDLRYANEELAKAQQELKKKQDEIRDSIPYSQYSELSILLAQRLSPEVRAERKCKARGRGSKERQ